MSDADDPNGVCASTPPRHSLGSTGFLSLSSGSSISPSSSSSGSAKSAVNECLGAWLNYLQILNNLCAAGYRLAQTIATLEQWGINEPMLFSTPLTLSNQQQTQSQHQSQSTPSHNQQQQAQTSSLLGNSYQSTTTPVATQFINAWDDLARATAVATSTVKSHIVSVLQEFVTQSLTVFESENELRDHNQQIIMETTQTMINIQHQFCVASYDSFSSLMCCLMCQAPVGFPHDSDCGFQKRQTSASNDLRSQTPSPHFGPLTMNVPKNERDMYRMGTTQQQQQQQQHSQQAQQPQSSTDSRNYLYGSGSSSEHSGSGANVLGLNQMTIGNRNIINVEVTPARVPSPHPDVRGPSPVQGFLENIRGPLPNPGHLLGMKAPFYRCSRSTLNFPLFPLNGQRRWSEAAAGEVKGEQTMMDAETMRRWSMPWESKSDRNTVTWHQTRIMPISKLAVPMMIAPNMTSRTSTDRSQTTTPDSVYQSSATSQDGLAEAIQLLSCRPSRIYQPPLGQSFVEEPHPTSNVGTYEMWSNRDQDRLPCIKISRNPNKMKDEQYHPPP